MKKLKRFKKGDKVKLSIKLSEAMLGDEATKKYKDLSKHIHTVIETTIRKEDGVQLIRTDCTSNQLGSDWFYIVKKKKESLVRKLIL